MPPQRLAEQGNRGGGARRRVGLCAQRPRRAHHHFEGRLDLGAPGGAREELGAQDDRAHDFPDIAVGSAEGGRRALDEGVARAVAHEAHGELPRDEARGARVLGDDVEHLLAVLDTAAALERVAEHLLGVGVVGAGAEDEAAPSAWLVDGPPGEGAGDVDHVSLRVTTVDAERVQLEQFATIVLVEPAPVTHHRAAVRQRSSAQFEQRVVQAVRDALRVVEVDQHRRAVRHGAEQVAEGAEDAWADDVALVLRQVVPHGRPLLDEHVEVIEPELGHHFLQLPFGLHGAGHARGLQLRDHLPLGALLFAETQGILRRRHLAVAGGCLLRHERWWRALHQVRRGTREQREARVE